MAKSPTGVRLSPDLEAAAKARAERLRFATMADYLRSLIRYDCLVGGDDHCVTKPIGERSLQEQDRIDADLLEWARNGKQGRGVLLERIIERALANGAQSEAEIRRRAAEEI